MGKSSKSIGILEGINLNSKEEKNLGTLEEKKETFLEEKTKRSYTLKNSTIKKLEELKLYHYDVKSKLEEIVDEAICFLYESKKQSKKE